MSLPGIKMEIGCEDVDWIKVAQGRAQWRVFVITAINVWVT